MVDVPFLPDARDEFDVAFDWYATRSPAAAVGFAAEVDEAIEKIAAHPTRFPTTDAGCRRCLLPRYPYSIIYYTDDEVSTVVAIAHAKRRPGYWLQRRH